MAEQREVNAVLQELLSAQGNETYVRDARLYATLPEELSFWDMFCRARSRNEIAIGYKVRLLPSHPMWNDSGIQMIDDARATLNPPDKSKKLRWQVGDAIVVISDH